MTIDELLELDDDAQIEYLNGQLDDGKSVDEICADLSNRIMLKPTRGYARTKPTKLG